MKTFSTINKTRPHNQRVSVLASLVVLSLAVVAGVMVDGVVEAAPPVEWPVAAGGNGHYYEGVCVTGITWTAASNAAVEAGGYLATITSSNENQVAFSTVNTNRFWHLLSGASKEMIGPWLGGYQLPNSVEPAGGWVWVDGPAFSYTSWDRSEPTGFAQGIDENSLQYHSHTNRAPTWNDSWDTLPAVWYCYGYVVEYNQKPPQAPTVTSISATNGILSLGWQQVGASASYQVESVASLGQTNWLPIAPTNQWPVTTNIWSSLLATNESGFFRVKALWTY